MAVTDERQVSRATVRTPYVLSVILGVCMTMQAVLGLAFPHYYRDTGYVGATWFGNDLVTLALAVPLLAAGLTMERRGSSRGRLLWFGSLGYGVYNYAFYLFGASLNAFFLLYVTEFLLATAAIILGLSRTSVREVASWFRERTPVRLIGGYLMFVAAGLTVVWVVMWAGYVFAGRPTPGDPEAFKIVAAMDLTVMVPALASGGFLLWRRHPWGYLISSIAAIQGALYLFVLALNSVLFILRGIAEAPGELSVWGSLCSATTIVAALLLFHSGRRD